MVNEQFDFTQGSDAKAALIFTGIQNGRQIANNVTKATIVIAISFIDFYDDLINGFHHSTEELH